jgi:hypothetical protein
MKRKGEEERKNKERKGKDGKLATTMQHPSVWYCTKDEHPW